MENDTSIIRNSAASFLFIFLCLCSFSSSFGLMGFGALGSCGLIVVGTGVGVMV